MPSKLRGAWSRCLIRRMKLEGEEKAKLAAKALQMSLAYQFVTPLTSMTMRGLADEDGLEPIIDKPTEGMISAVGEALGLGEASGGFNSPPFLSLPGSPLGEFLNHVGFLKGFPVAGQVARAPGLRQAASTPSPCLQPFVVSSSPCRHTLVAASWHSLNPRWPPVGPRVSACCGGLGPQEEGGPGPEWPLGSGCF